VTLEHVMVCLCLLALRDLRLRLGLDPIAGDGCCAVDGVYDGMEEV
jgi:hypothetical protein